MKSVCVPNLMALITVWVLAATTSHAQSDSPFYHPLTPASADAETGGAAADDQNAQEAELAMKLQNPLASLISLPIQNNWDFGIGPANAMRYTANVQPVIPFSITEDWNVITRTIVPVIYAESPVQGGSSKFGLGDQLLKIGKVPVSLGIGGRYYAEGPSGGPEWGMRFVLQFLFPK